MKTIYIRIDDEYRVPIKDETEINNYLEDGYLIIKLNEPIGEFKWVACPAYSSKENASNKYMQDAWHWISIGTPIIEEMKVGETHPILKRIKDREDFNKRWNWELFKAGLFNFVRL